MTEYATIINGRDVCLSGRTFNAQSPFYPEYSVDIADSGAEDIRTAISYATSMSARSMLRNIPFKQLKQILDDAADRIHFTDEDEEHCVRMMGVPRKWIRNYMMQVPAALRAITRDVQSRYDHTDGLIGRMYDGGRFEFKEPRNGFMYSIVPSNDPRATNFVLMCSILGRTPAVLKVSKNEISVSRKVVHALVEAGYPPQAISMLCWDTTDRMAALEKHAQVCQAASVIIPFGSDDTVDETLRYFSRQRLDEGELRKYTGQVLDERILQAAQVTEKIDLFSGKDLRHTTGNCAIIVDEGVSAETAAKLITYSAYHYPISCKAGKAVYTVGERQDIVEAVAELASCLEVSDPLGETTEIGYVDEETLDAVIQNSEMKLRHGQLRSHAEIQRISPHQSTPMLFSTQDIASPFLEQEISVYLATFLAAPSLEAAIAACNKGNRGKKRLAVSVLSPNALPATFLQSINANQIHRNLPTNNLHGSIHQGVNYVEALSRTQSIIGAAP